MRLALLTNSDSGSGEADRVEQVLQRHGAEVSPFGLDEIEVAVASGPDRIVVAGGDGSIGPVAEAAGRAGVPLAVVPTGTANDFARAAGLPSDPEDACRLAAGDGETRSYELLSLGDRPFVNAASAGLAPVAAEHAHDLKHLLGAIAYAVGAIRAALTADPVQCTVHIDGTEFFSGPAWQVIVAGTGAFGGGSKVQADPQDGRLHVVVIEAGSRFWLVRHGYGLRKGTVERGRGVRHARGTAAALSTPESELALNVDGELVHERSARFSARADAFRLVC